MGGEEEKGGLLLMKEEEEEEADVVCNVSYRSFVRRTQLPVAHNILTYVHAYFHTKEIVLYTRYVSFF